MVSIGYTMMCEQSPPDLLVRDIQRAEDAGFDFSVISDHFNPWLDEQGHSGYAWSILGAASQVTSRIPLMTYVTCPLIRYHPAVVAQKAATMQILSGGRFRLGLGAGENLNEHVVGEGWPAVGQRHEMLDEAVEVIQLLFSGEQVSHRGTYYQVESARLYDLPDERVPIGIACSGHESCTIAGRRADLMIATEPKAELGELFDSAGGAGKPRVGQMPISYDVSKDAAIKRAHEQFRWTGLGWPVNSELPTPAGFASASASVRPEDIAEQVACGPDVDHVVEKAKAYVGAGFTELALVQIGADQQETFCSWAEKELLPALRSL